MLQPLPSTSLPIHPAIGCLVSSSSDEASIYKLRSDKLEVKCGFSRYLQRAAGHCPHYWQGDNSFTCMWFVLFPLSVGQVGHGSTFTRARAFCTLFLHFPHMLAFTVREKREFYDFLKIKLSVRKCLFNFLL